VFDALRSVDGQANVQSVMGDHDSMLTQFPVPVVCLLWGLLGIQPEASAERQRETLLLLEWLMASASSTHGTLWTSLAASLYSMSPSKSQVLLLLPLFSLFYASCESIIRLICV
jgi:hypothetical protein